MTTSNKTNQVQSTFKAECIASRRGYVVTYEKGLELVLKKSVVDGVRGVHTTYVDSMLTAEKALADAFDSVASECHAKGLSKLQAGKVIALVLQVDKISSAHDDKDVSNRIKAKWHYVANKYYKVVKAEKPTDENATDEKATDEKATDEKASDASDASELSKNGKPYTIEELIVNKKLGTLGELLGTRIKETNDRLTLIMGLLADATADDVEAIAKVLTAPSKAKETVQPPKPEATRRKTTKA